MSEQPANYGKPWTRNQLILAFDLYCRIPFKRTKASTPEVQQLARLLHRSPASVARKLGNFGAFDPELRKQNILGLGHGSKLDEEIWEEFNRDWNKLVLNAHDLRQTMSHEQSDNVQSTEFIIPDGPSERAAIGKQRIHQSFFRQAILSSYESTCCVTGLSIPQCLVASHIVPWSKGEAIRADPTNGLCLSATFDRLFDSGLMTITIELTIRLSKHILHHTDHTVRQAIAIYEQKSILRPRRFLPSKEFLKWHHEHIFID